LHFLGKLNYGFLLQRVFSLNIIAKAAGLAHETTSSRSVSMTEVIVH